MEEDDEHRADPIDGRAHPERGEAVEPAGHERSAALRCDRAEEDPECRAHHEPARDEREVGGEAAAQQWRDRLEAQLAIPRRAEIEVQERAVEEVQELVRIARAIRDALGAERVEDAEDERGDADHHGDDGQQATNDEGEHGRTGSLR
jgi:hypothetical protein